MFDAEDGKTNYCCRCFYLFSRDHYTQILSFMIKYNTYAESALAVFLNLATAVLAVIAADVLNT
jgi:hypothetical protein